MRRRAFNASTLRQIAHHPVVGARRQDWILPGDPAYDQARRVFNGAIDRFPSAVVYCRNEDEVAEALKVARDQGLMVTVRSSGHNVAGRAVANDAIVIDVSRCNSVDVNAEDQYAVTGPGVTWAEFDMATQRFGLATTGGTVSSTGVGGLTLGGGVGWLLPSMGLTCDHLISARVMTTTGEVIQVTVDKNRECLWALRGGGNNLGIVTSLTLTLEKVESVTGGYIVFDLSAAERILNRLGAILDSLPRSLMVMPAMMHVDGRDVLEIDVMDRDATGKSLSDFLVQIQTDDPPRAVHLGIHEYCEMQKMLDNPRRKGQPAYWKSRSTKSLTPTLASHLVKVFKRKPAPECMIMLEHYHGAFEDYDSDRSAYPFREKMLNILAIGAHSQTHSHVITAATEASRRWSVMVMDFEGQGSIDSPYVNYLSEEELTTWRNANPHYGRLVKMQRYLDPLGMLPELDSMRDV